MSHKASLTQHLFVTKHILGSAVGYYASFGHDYSARTQLLYHVDVMGRHYAGVLESAQLLHHQPA